MDGWGEAFVWRRKGGTGGGGGWPRGEGGILGGGNLNVVLWFIGMQAKKTNEIINSMQINHALAEILLEWA